MVTTPGLVRWVPLLFVPLWSTGFIGAKYALPYIEPFTLLMIRMYLTLGVFLLLIGLYRSRWPGLWGAANSMVAGALIHGAYLGGVFAAIKAGMAAGLAALLVGLQPLLTAFIAWAWSGQRITGVQALGLVAGLLGVALVLLPGELHGRVFAFPPVAFAFISIALLGISLGTLYQKRYCGGIELLTGTFCQYSAAALIMTFLSFSFETREIQWTVPLLSALLWLVFGLSLTAVLLLMLMIRHGESTKVASYFYLTPPVTAVFAWLLFGETLAPSGILGIGITALGVYLVVKSPRWRSC